MQNDKKFKVNIENYDDDIVDIYSNVKEDIYSTRANHKKSKKKKTKNIKKRLYRAIIILASILIIFIVVLYSYTYSILNNIKKVEIDKEDLNITTNNYDDYKNIALFGIDSRQDNDSGRADANLVITIDKKNKKIKLTSIARDSYVDIEGHKKDKLTHAYAYGKSQLSVKTLNENFGLEITDYVTVNFFGLARIIDYIGGVTVDVDKKEFNEINNLILTTNFKDVPSEKLKSYGLVKLSGAQAVCYSRIRKIDGDIERGNRQKEVLSAMFSAVKSKNVLSLPKIAQLVLGECESSLSVNDIISLGSWAVMSSPEIEQISIPNDNVKGKGKTIKGVWYYMYDIEAAKNEINDFIKEINYYSPQEVKNRLENKNQ